MTNIGSSASPCNSGGQQGLGDTGSSGWVARLAVGLPGRPSARESAPSRSMTATTRVSPSNGHLFEMRLQFTRPGHQPRTMRRLVWCHHLLADIRIGDIAGYDRFPTSVIELPQFPSFGPFPKSARVTIYRDSHDYRPFAGIWTHISGDEMKTCEVRIVLPAWTSARPNLFGGVATLRTPDHRQDEMGMTRGGQTKPLLCLPFDQDIFRRSDSSSFLLPIRSPVDCKAPRLCELRRRQIRGNTIVS